MHVLGVAKFARCNLVRQSVGYKCTICTTWNLSFYSRDAKIFSPDAKGKLTASSGSSLFVDQRSIGGREWGAGRLSGASLQASTGQRKWGAVAAGPTITSWSYQTRPSMTVVKRSTSADSWTQEMNHERLTGSRYLIPPNMLLSLGIFCTISI